MKTPLMTSKSGGKAPQCKVCGDESSGFHYGVDSCEGCKGFFRRCITQGMNHKCANEEKCEITPFTRNSCQYCRLKKCFEVGMSREASRLGRRPKRLKEVGGDGSGGSRSHTSNLPPIAPYPSPQELYRMRMAELQKILQSNGTFKAELMQAFLSAAKASFQEHSKTSQGESGKGHGKGHSSRKTDSSGVSNTNQNYVSGSSVMPSATLVSDSVTSDTGGGGGGGGLSGLDSPSSLNSPGGSYMDLNSLAALDNFLFEHGLPSTPGGGQQNSVDASPDMQAINSPFNLNSVSLDPVSNAASPLSEFGMGSPLMGPGSVANENCGSDSNIGHSLNNANFLNANTPSTSAAPTPPPHTSHLHCMQQQQQQHQQYQQQQQQLLPELPIFPGTSSVQVKMEPMVDMEATQRAEPAVKTEPLSPVMLPVFGGPLPSPINAIMDEVLQTPSETRRLLIEQVTDAVVEAHLATTINTHNAVSEAYKRLGSSDENGMPDMSKLTLDPKSVWQKFMAAMVPEITKCVKFCKKLPGFLEIEQDDQIRLIKQGSFEVMLARFSMLVDHSRQEMLDPTHSLRCPRHVVRGLQMGEFLDEFFYVASHFNPLKLTDGEIGLFTSVLIICPDRDGLRNQKAISKIQSLLQQALYYLMKHNHPDPDGRFAQLMGMIPMFRHINKEHARALNSIRMNSPEEFGNQFPELHREIYDQKV